MKKNIEGFAFTAIGFFIVASLITVGCLKSDAVRWGVGVDRIAAFGRPSGILDKIKTDICKG